jgi:thiol-disulfide isomerase/thioredoxin
MGPITLGTYSFDGINYADCGLCLLAYVNCDGSSCEKTLYAEEGSVEISEIGFETGDTFSAQLNGVVFREVEIDPSTYQSTVIPDGDTWCFDGFEFTQEVAIPEPPAPAECPDSANCIGAEIPDYQLMSCATGEMVSAHSLMDTQEKGLWMVLTASWCSACRQFIPEVRNTESELETNGVHVIYVMGENTDYLEPSLMECQQYANVYGEGALDRFYIDFSEGAAFRSTFDAMWPYTGPMGEFGLPWNGMVRSGMYNYEYVYADGSGVGDLNVGVNSLINNP